MARFDSAALEVRHVAIEFDVGFDPFVAQLERVLGLLDPAALSLMTSDPTAARSKLEASQGEQGLMLFSSQNHGGLFAMQGKLRKAVRMHIGNPLIAFEMTQHEIRAALYMPLTVLIYERTPAAVTVEFELPSSQFAQFGNPTIDLVARALDDKLEAVLDRAASLARKPAGATSGPSST